MTTFLQLTFAGLALGSVYALVALGFTIVFKASRIINFAQGEMLAFGAFFVSWLVINHGFSFWLAFLLGLAATTALGLAFQLGVLRFAVGRPDFTVVMLTLGLATVLQSVIPTFWGSNPRSNGDPWGASAVHGAGVTFQWDEIWSIITAVLLLVAFYAFNRYTPYGIAMRAAASDEEAALAVGIPLRRVHATAWGLAGLVACIGGVFLAGYPNSLDPTISNAALFAFPAIILGGIDSTSGAVIGGFVIGVIRLWIQGYVPTALGADFYLAAPYIVMIVVLLIRPYGLFGSRPAERL
jgi:branched-chain amino acid transport system permease protein